MRYRRTALFRNDDPWAESDTSQASQGFLVRRTDSGAWEAQLVTRNSVTLDTPGEWERVPSGSLRPGRRPGGAGPLAVGAQGVVDPLEGWASA